MTLKGNHFANTGICILFLWAVIFIPWVILVNVNQAISGIPGAAALFVGILGAPLSFLFGCISSFKTPRKMGALTILLSILIFLVSIATIVPKIFHS